MVTQAERQKSYTLAEYIELEVNSEERHEYINGEIVLMVGGTPNHNKLAGNFYATLNFALKRQPYEVFVTDQRLWIPQKRRYTYPDVMVVQSPLQLQEGRNDTITNPLIIAEVLSNSTEAYDRGDKFSAYRTIPSFQEYILIAQNSFHIEQFTKTESGQWLLSEYDGKDAILSLVSISLQIPLSDIYDKVDFESELEENQ